MLVDTICKYINPDIGNVIYSYIDPFKIQYNEVLDDLKRYSGRFCVKCLANFDEFQVYIPPYYIYPHYICHCELNLCGGCFSHHRNMCSVGDKCYSVQYHKNDNFLFPV